MLYPFFALAAQSPTRQRTFRRAVVAHLVFLAGSVWLMHGQPAAQGAPLLGHLLLVAGIVEGATLVGWRLTQLPKSQALEFLLVSPLRPGYFLAAEALVGLVQLGLITLAGLPVLLFLVVDGRLAPLDPGPLLVMPWTWGALTGLALTVWAYEPARVRRWGERVLMGLVLVYLIVGVLAAENLPFWLGLLPPRVGVGILRGFVLLQQHNPFGVLSFWLTHDARIAWERMRDLELATLAVVGGLLFRAAWRLPGHFDELHHEPVADVSRQHRPAVPARALTWWAVKRVSRYSGRINLWLAGGFGVLYALYLVAGPHWPAWMGRQVFHLCDRAGGVAGLTTALVLLAAVPAAFQYGLWDSSNQDRCRRLELLLLTELDGHDYWHAAATAAWRRGRGYLGVAGLLWVAAALAGRLTPMQAATALATAVLLWGMYFALGFRAFARGRQANGLGMLLTVGLPLATFVLGKLAGPAFAALLPPGQVYQAARAPASHMTLLGAVLGATLTLSVARRALRQCDTQLRAWYDLHHGQKVMS